MPRTGLTPQQISDAAIELATKRIKRDGFKKVRLIDIARDLDISHAALYAHFTNKDDLLDSVTAKWIAEIDVALQKICDENADPIDAIYKWFLCLYQRKHSRVVGEPELFEGFDVAASNKKPFIKKHLNSMHSQMSILVGRAMENKQFKAQSADLVAGLLIEATCGFHHPNIVADHSGEERIPKLNALLDVMIAGLKY